MNQSGQKGFTLIEVLVVAVLLTVMLGLIYLFQRSTVRTMKSTENKEEAVNTSHLVYELIHHQLLNAKSHWCPRKVTDNYEMDEDRGSPMLILDNGVLHFPKGGSTLSLDGKSVHKGINQVSFFRRQNHIVPFIVAVDRARQPKSGRAFREQSMLFGAHFMQAEADEKTYEHFSAQDDNNHPCCLNGFAAIHGWMKEKED